MPRITDSSLWSFPLWSSFPLADSKDSTCTTWSSISSWTRPSRRFRLISLGLPLKQVKLLQNIGLLMVEEWKAHLPQITWNIIRGWANHVISQSIMMRPTLYAPDPVPIIHARHISYPFQSLNVKFFTDERLASINLLHLLSPDLQRNQSHELPLTSILVYANQVPNRWPS